MTLLLELERSYQASTRLITTIDNMLRTPCCRRRVRP